MHQPEPIATNKNGISPSATTTITATPHDPTNGTMSQNPSNQDQNIVISSRNFSKITNLAQNNSLNVTTENIVEEKIAEVNKA